MIVGLAIGGVVGALVGCIGAMREWSAVKTGLIANAIALPLLAIAIITGAAS